MRIDQWHRQMMRTDAEYRAAWFAHARGSSAFGSVEHRYDVSAEVA